MPRALASLEIHNWAAISVIISAQDLLSVVQVSARLRLGSISFGRVSTPERGAASARANSIVPGVASFKARFFAFVKFSVLAAESAVRGRALAPRAALRSVFFLRFL